MEDRETAWIEQIADLQASLTKIVAENAKLRADLDAMRLAAVKLANGWKTESKTLELQVRELTGKLKAIAEIPEGRRDIEGESWPCPNCVEKTRHALFADKQECEHQWIGGSLEGYRCTKCPAVAGRYCNVCHEPMEGNRMGLCWKCQKQVEGKCVT